MDHLIRGDKASALVAADRGAALAPDLDVGAFARGVGARARRASSGPKAVATVLRECIDRYPANRTVRSLLGLYLAEAELAGGSVAEAHAAARQSLETAQAGRFAWGSGATHRLLGQLALQRQDLVTTRASLDEALATFTAIPAPFEVAVTRLDLARLAGTGGDREARAHLAEARAGFAALGLDDWVQRTDALAAGRTTELA